MTAIISARGGRDAIHAAPESTVGCVKRTNVSTTPSFVMVRFMHPTGYAAEKRLPTARAVLRTSARYFVRTSR
jgi:hypothetical protein